MTGYGVLGDLWQRLYVPPPPARPACEGEPPALTDLPADYARAITTHTERNHPLPDYVRTHISGALAMCADCPLAVRQWCDEATAAKLSGASIIAGGKVYARGKVRWDLDRERRRTERAA